MCQFRTQRVAHRTGSGTGTIGLNWLLGDHLSSASLTADPVDGDKLSELRYKAWGETRYALTSLPTDRRYTGQVEEATIGLHFFNARWYDSYLNRWIQPDTIIPQNQGVQAWDRYAYANNNPIRYTDPSGHCIDGISTALCIAIGVGAVAGGIAGGAGYIAAAKITKQEINLKSLAIAVGGGVLAGALTPVVAVLAPSASSAIAGTLALNGTVTAAQYVADQTVNEKPVSATTTVANFGIGVIGGTIGGTYTPFDEIGKEGISQGLKLSIEFGKNAVTQFEKETSAQFLRYQARIGASNMVRTFGSYMTQFGLNKLWPNIDPEKQPLLDPTPSNKR